MPWDFLKGFFGRVGSEITSKPRQPGHFAREEKGDGIKLTKVVHKIQKDYKHTKKALKLHAAGKLKLSEEEMRKHMNTMTKIVTDVLQEAINLFAWEIDNIKEILRADVEAARRGYDNATAKTLIRELDKSLENISVESSDKGNVLLSLSNEARRDEIR